MKRKITTLQNRKVPVNYEFQLPYFCKGKYSSEKWGLFEDRIVRIIEGHFRCINFYHWEDFENSENLYHPFDASEMQLLEKIEPDTFFESLNKIKHDIEQIGAQANATERTENTNIDLC